jgi:hypothetical protein
MAWKNIPPYPAGGGGIGVAGQVGPPSTPNEWLAYIENYAASNVPAPSTSLHGDLFYGWPVDYLFSKVPLQHKSAVMLEFMKKHKANMVLQASMASKASGAGMAQAVYKPPPHSLYEMLSMRMRWTGGDNPFTHVDIQTAGEKAFVWIITKDAQSVVLEDEAAMFPSDKLITQIRML